MQVPNTIGYTEPEPAAPPEEPEPDVEGKKPKHKKAAKKPRKPKKNMDIELFGLWGHGEPVRVQPEVFTPSGDEDGPSSVVPHVAASA